MTWNTNHVRPGRGQRLDLHITALRNDAEDAYGAAFTDASALGKRIDSPDLTDAQFDTEVIGLLCSVILKVRPLPKFLRKALGLLLQVAPEERADLMLVPIGGRQSTVHARTDRTVLDFVIDNLKENLYPPHAVAGPFTDFACGLGGLKLTWQRDVLSEADENGIISIDGLKRIRSKLASATLSKGEPGQLIVFDGTVDVSKTNGQAIDKDLERRLKLIEIVERAINFGSTVECVPSRIREERISQAYERSSIAAGRTA